MTINPSTFHSISQKLTNHAKKALTRAEQLAERFQASETHNIHLLFGVFSEKGSLGSNILVDLGLKKENFLRVLNARRSRVRLVHAKKTFIPLSESAKKSFVGAFAAAKNFNYAHVGTEHLVFALLNSKDSVIQELLTGEELKTIGQSIQSLLDPSQSSPFSKMFNLPEVIIGKNKSNKTSATPYIDKFCLNINQEAQKKNEVLVGREQEISRMINILGRKNKNNPLLIGDPGVGKTILVSGLARLINTGQVPEKLYNKKIMSLDIAQLIAGTSFRGEFEARLKEIIREATAQQNIIIFIDEIHNIVGAGNTAGSLDLANILKPALARGELQLIGATTRAEYKKYIEKDAALERRFQPINVSEPSPAEAEKILFGIREAYETFHNVTLTDSAIRLAVELSARYVQNRFLPDKAIDTLDEAASNVRSKNRVSDFIRQIRTLENQKITLLEEKEHLVLEEKYVEASALKSQEKSLTEKIASFRQKQTRAEKTQRITISDTDIIETIAKISGVPTEKLARAKSRKIKNIATVLARKIIGQKEALEKVSTALLRSQTGIANPDRPIGSFLFLGPTGVGKTLTAKVIAQEFFDAASDKNNSLIRIDMSELMERHSVASLIGSPAGYIGYGEGGNLTEKIRRNPYSVVLFDEIEKAHPDVFNILLQILEDGTLTDAEGTKVSFKNSIIILTSNIGTEEFTQAVGSIGFADSDSKDAQRSTAEKFASIQEKVIKELERRMKPELLNRLDHVIVFKALDKKDLLKITNLELAELTQRLKQQNVKLIVDKKVIAFIAEKSFAANFGARRVRKNVQEMLEPKIAHLLIHDRVKNAKITVAIEKEEIKVA